MLSHKRTSTAVALSALVTAALAGSLLVTPGASAEDDDTDPELARLESGTSSLAVVNASNQKQRTKIVDLGLDATSKVTAKGMEVILHGPKDGQALKDAGFSYTIKEPDLAKRERANAKKNRAYAEATPKSPLPSGRNSYRTLADYNKGLNQLAKKFPKVTRPITLKNRTVQGRKVQGLEITKNADKVNDGKPVFLLMGLHHAREWPSGEVTMEHAYDLLKNYQSRLGDERAKKIVENSRTIVVPVVNPDGFDVSREAIPKGDFTTFDYEMKRKGCSVSENTPAQFLGGTCDDNPAGRLRGTDLNRNYPGFWGGAGASPTWSSDTYRGDAPGNEPEVDNIRSLISSRQVTGLISNHTYSNLVLRPPSIADTGLTPDEPAYKELGAAMAESNGYTNQRSFELYDTSGSTEDWSYWNTGGFGFTFEIGATEFHPAYQDGVVAEYLGLPPSSGAGKGGIRESFYTMATASIDRSLHSTIKGAAPKGHTLQVRKRFITPTSPVIGEDGSESAPLYYEDILSSKLDSTGGAFTWALNPSTRPLVVGRYGRDPVAPPQDGLTLTNPAGIPAVGQSEETKFTIQGPPDADNGVARVEVKWPGESGDEAVDWDVEIFDSAGKPVASAATLDDPEVATMLDPAPGEYTVRVTNYAGGAAANDWTGKVDFRSPTPASYSGLKEAWTLTCTKDSNGKVVGTREVIVDRGKTKNIGSVCNKNQNVNKR